MQDRTRIATFHRLLGALVCLCLVVQPLLVPLHLATDSHTHHAVAGLASKHSVPGSLHVHSHDHGNDRSHRHDHDGRAHSHEHGHSHPHGHSSDPCDGGDASDSHPPHPAEDHDGGADELQRASAAQQIETDGLLPAPWPVIFAVGFSEPLSAPAPKVPERPPPRGAAQSRAPPAIV
jgi:hypothetical protein